MKHKKGLILSAFLFISLIFLMAFSSADWRTYGNSNNLPIWNSEETLKGRLDLGISELSMPYGITTNDNFIAYQPIVTELNGKIFIILQSGNYLQVYDDNFNLLAEKLEHSISQLSTIDWDFDGLANDFVGIFENNSTSVTFKVFNFNINSYALTNIFEENFTTDGNHSVAGLRNVISRGGVSDGIPFVLNYYKSSGGVYSAKYIRINNTATIQTIITNSTQPYYEPLSIQDVDNDGRREYMTYSKERIVIFREDGTIVTNIQVSGGKNILSARLFRADLTNLWKIVYFEGSSISSNFDVIARRIDGSALWTYSGSLGFGGFETSQIAVVNNYDGDTTDNELFICVSASGGANQIVWKPTILKGKNGVSLVSSLIQVTQTGVLGTLTAPSSCSVADMNNNGKLDFIMSYGKNTIIQDENAGTLYNAVDGIHFGCIPTDINFDGTLEVLCSGSNSTKILYNQNYSNQNAIINSVTYSPATTIIKQTSVNALISATDPEGDSPLYYISKCFNSDSWSSADNNPLKTCYYALSGIYNLSVGVRDPYSSSYNYFSQQVIVTETGTICGNAICELGETNANCPNDCPSNITTTQATDIGGMPLPTKIVDTNNIEQGLLPEIYYGILAFLSGTLTPMIILIFVIFFALIILSIGFIIKKIAHRVGDLAR